MTAVILVEQIKNQIILSNRGYRFLVIEIAKPDVISIMIYFSYYIYLKTFYTIIYGKVNM